MIVIVYSVNENQFRLILYFDLFDLENFRFGSQKLQQTPAYYYYKYWKFFYVLPIDNVQLETSGRFRVWKFSIRRERLKY